MIVRFANGIVQIALPESVEIEAESLEAAEEEYIGTLLEKGTIQFFSADGEVEVDARVSCHHPTFNSKNMSD